MNRIVKKTFSTLAAVLLSLLVLGFVAIFILSSLGVARFVPVLSNSMAPAMPTGSLAVVLGEPRQSIVSGDVIVFTAPDGSRRRVIHRVQKIYGPDEATKIRDWTPDRLFLETKGDNNPRADPWILTLADATIWKRYTVIPAAGWPAIWFANPTIRMIAFGLGGALVTVWALTAIWRRPEIEDTAPAADHDTHTPAETTTTQ